MKKIFVLALLLAACAALPSAAAVLDGGFFTVEVPEGWELQTEESSDTAGIFVSPDRTVVFSVTKILSPSQSLRDMAEQFAGLHGAKDLTKMEGEGEAYEYTGKVSGKPMYAQVFSLDQNSCGYISIIGNYDDPAATEIFNGIEFK